SNTLAAAPRLAGPPTPRIPKGRSTTSANDADRAWPRIRSAVTSPASPAPTRNAGRRALTTSPPHADGPAAVDRRPRTRRPAEERTRRHVDALLGEVLGEAGAQAGRHQLAVDPTVTRPGRPIGEDVLEEDRVALESLHLG